MRNNVLRKSLDRKWI